MDILGFFNLASQGKLVLTLLLALALITLLTLIFVKRLSSFFFKHEKTILKLLIVFLLVLQIIFLFNSRVSDDDRFHLHSSYLVSLGEKPYVDFFGHHMPVYYFLLSQFFSFLSDPTLILFIGRFISLFFIALILFFTYKITRLYYDDKTALYAVVFTILFREFFTFAFTIRADGIAAALFFAAIYSALYYHKSNPNKLYLFYSSLLFFASLAFSQKMVFSIALFLLGFLIMRKLDKKPIFTDFLIISSSLIALGVAFTGALYLYFSQAGFLELLKMTITFNNAVMFSNPLLHNLITMTITNGIFIFLIGYAIISQTRKSISSGLMIVIISLIPFLGLMVYKKMLGAQYFFYFLPFLAILASLAFNRLRKKLPDWTMFLAILIIILVPLAAFGIDLQRSSGLSNDIKELREFNALYSPNQSILDKGYFIFHKNYEYLDFDFSYEETLRKIGMNHEYDRTNLIASIKPDLIFTKKNESLPEDYQETQMPNLYSKSLNTLH